MSVYLIDTQNQTCTVVLPYSECSHDSLLTIKDSFGNASVSSIIIHTCTDYTPPDTFPDNIDYQWYINKTTEMLYDIAYYQKPKQKELF